jgi:ABC-type dipeptide/oligopeptide/nickel transport system permease subunit
VHSTMNGPIVFGRMWRKAMRMCSSVLSIREMQYVEAARALGINHLPDDMCKGKFT